MAAGSSVPRRYRRPLDPFFSPAVVAVIGATEAERSIGLAIMRNLAAFPGLVHPVNPNRAAVLGRKAYPNIGAAPDPVDLAVIATPADAVTGVVAECAAAGVPAAIVISSGFKETGERGAALEREIAATRGSMRILGPNCFGLIAPYSGLNASLASDAVRPGSIAFISQSGALCSAILDWSLREMIGFSAFVSSGSMLDVGWGDLIDYLGADAHTRAILMYMESVGEARQFLSAAREVALTKPIIVIKAGRTCAAAIAAASHTGALVGSDAVLDAALRRCGVLRVERVSDLFYMAEALSRQPRPAGPRLAIVTNAGGLGVLATDALIAQGGELAPLSAETIASLDRNLPPHWSRQNPVDILGDAPPERYSEALQAAAADPKTDGILVGFAPQGITTAAEAAEHIVQTAARIRNKPVLATWMGGAGVARGEEILASAGIPTFPYPDSAVRTFVNMWRYTENLRALYETPELAEASIDRETCATLLREARAENRVLLSESESKWLLASYGIPVTLAAAAATEDDAVHLAEQIGYPVAMKLHSKTLTHKAEAGGVELNLADASAVRAAWRRISSSVVSRVGARHFQGVSVQRMESLAQGLELILGCSCDPQFGPVLLFGAGGEQVETLQDSALGLPPLNSTLARRMMERTRIYHALGGIRGRQPVDRGALEQILVRFSQLVAEIPRIREIDINPLFAAPGRITALDARVLLHEWSISDAALPRTAIRPYPSAYVRSVTLPGGEVVMLRPIRPEDEPKMVRFHATLSERSVYYRYFHLLGLTERVSHERLTRICFIDYNREIALVAETAQQEIVAVGRLTRTQDGKAAEFALLVADAWQSRGIGTELLRNLTAIARKEGIGHVYGHILAENRAMVRVCEALGFRLGDPSDGELEASLSLP